MVRIQAVDEMGNLVFVLFLVAIAILTASLIYRKLRGRGIGSLAFAVLACLAAYGVALVGVSLRSETRSLNPGDEKCFDDWCATLSRSRSLLNPHGNSGTKLVAITLSVSNQARRAAFRPSQPRVILLLNSGVTVRPSAAAQHELEKYAGPQQDLAKRLIAGESFETALAFEVPSATKEASVVVFEGPAIVTRILVGDENSFFHKKIGYPIAVD